MIGRLRLNALYDEDAVIAPSSTGQGAPWPTACTRGSIARALRMPNGQFRIGLGPPGTDAHGETAHREYTSLPAIIEDPGLAYFDSS